MKKHRYSTEFKVTAVKLAAHPGMETQEVAAALNIHPFMLSRWKKEYREGKLQGPAHPSLKEIRHLEETVAGIGKRCWKKVSGTFFYCQGGWVRLR
jgi:transposase-like protein